MSVEVANENSKKNLILPVNLIIEKQQAKAWKANGTHLYSNLPSYGV